MKGAMSRNLYFLAASLLLFLSWKCLFINLQVGPDPE